jgi:hypothetical protein
MVGRRLKTTVRSFTAGTNLHGAVLDEVSSHEAQNVGDGRAGRKRLLALWQFVEGQKRFTRIHSTVEARAVHFLVSCQRRTSS